MQINILMTDNPSYLDTICGDNNRSILPINGYSLLFEKIENIKECKNIRKINIQMKQGDNTLLSILKNKFPNLKFQISDYQIKNSSNDICFIMANVITKIDYAHYIETFRTKKYPALLIEKLDGSDTPALLILEKGSQLLYKCSNILTLFSGIGELKDIHVIRVNFKSLNSYDDFKIIYQRNEKYYPDKTSIVDIFRETAKRKAQAKALVYKDISISFKKLDIITDILASNIKANIKKQEGKIAIYLEKSEKYIISMLAILKAGYTYIPLDKVYPLSRVKRILEIAKVNLIITDEDIEFGHSSVSIPYEVLLGNTDNVYTKELTVPIDHNTTAYIMFTSGSTGEPKGVKISHRNIINNVWGLKKDVYDLYGTKELDISVIAAFVFDLSVQQIYPSLLLGHTLHIMPSNYSHNPEKAISFMNNLDLCEGTPTFLSMIINYIEKRKCSLPNHLHFIVGGEELPYNLTKKYFRFFPNNLMTNIYGPTECTVEATTYRLDKNIVDKSTEVLIGTPMINARIYVLDENRRFVKYEQEGEIYIAGDCVGQGYINNSSNESFIPDILYDTEIMYKTGDLAKWTYQGSLKFIGRKDLQVKYKGYRVELSEIETAIEKHDSIQNAKVFLFTDDNEEKVLVAYIIPKEQTVSVSELRNHLSKILPQYMIPSYFVLVTKYPVNISGKLDTRELPNYKKFYLHEEHTKPTKVIVNDTHLKLSSIVKKQLKLESIHFDESLRSMGGDSLALILIIVEIELHFNVALPLQIMNLDLNLDDITNLILTQTKIEKNSNSKKMTKKKQGNRTKSMPMQRKLISTENESSAIFKENKANHMTFFVELSGFPDIYKLKKALEHVLNRNDAFRTIFYQKGDKVFAILEEQMVYREIEIVELADLSYENMHTKLSDYNLLELPLYEFILFKNKNDYRLCVSIHHAIFDYLSFFILMSELDYAYYNEGDSVKICDSFFTYIQNYYHRDSREEANKFWRNHAQNFVITKIPEKVGVQINNYNSNTEIKKIKTDLNILGIREFCKQNELSENHTLLESFLETIRFFISSNKLTIGLFVSGRNRYNIDAIGFFSTLIPFNYNYDTMQYIDRIKDVAEVLKEHEKFSDWYDLYKDTREYSIVFDYQKLYNTKSHHTLWKTADIYETANILIPFVFRIYDYGDNAKLVIEYDSLKIDAPLINSFVYKYLETLNNHCAGIET